jgi:exoribonuclease R
MNFGLFVDIPKLQIGGLIHVSSLSERFVRFDRRKHVLRAGNQVFKRGMRIQVCVARVDTDKRQIDFVPTGN